MRLGSVLGTSCRGENLRLLSFHHGGIRYLRVTVDVRPKYGDFVLSC